MISNFERDGPPYRDAQHKSRIIIIISEKEVLLSKSRNWSKVYFKNCFHKELKRIILTGPSFFVGKVRKQGFFCPLTGPNT